MERSLTELQRARVRFLLRPSEEALLAFEALGGDAEDEDVLLQQALTDIVQILPVVSPNGDWLRGLQVALLGVCATVHPDLLELIDGRG